MSEDRQGMEEIDRLIHSPARLTIVRVLAVLAAADFTFLLNQTGLTRGNLSSNLGKLEEAGYVAIKKEFVNKIPRTVVRLSSKGRKAVNAYCDQMRQVLDELEPS